MLLVILLGLGAMGVAGLFLWFVVSNVDDDDPLSWIGGIMTFVGFIAMFIFGIVWGIVYYGSYNDIQQLYAFQNETRSIYDYTVDRTESVVIDAGRTRGGSITDFSYQQQGQSVSERIKELRNRAELHNSKLYELRGKNKVPIIGEMYADVPEDLKPIKLETLP